jgi:UDP-N-acetylmuramoyl-L-alanyl-D-glutamate--2,6-diaminopimelate ligase
MNYKKLLNLLSSPNSPSLSADSRAITPSGIFVAVKGTQFDGHSFIPQAIKNGAKYIITQDNIEPIQSIEIIKVADTSSALAELAQAKFDNPAKKLTNLAVTGTNGKTTVAFLVQSVINAADKNCGLIGTVITDTVKQKITSQLTTPDPVFIADCQAQMAAAGTEFMIIEASSHALHQNRLANIPFTAAAFTNLTGDHLDYHENFDNYLSAKSILFENLTENDFAILNKQAPQSQTIAKNTKAKIIYYAVDEPADITAEIITQTTAHTKYTLKYKDQTIEINSPLLGLHNVSNHLAAAGLALAAGFSLDHIKTGLQNHKIIPGRLEPIPSDKPFTVLIDYAHTDDALTNVLNTLKPLCKNKLITLFGCGGDRDKTKRPRMAAAAQQLSDIVIVTSDNPRTEDPDQIIDDILKGFDNTENIIVQPDREKAIDIAINTAQADDIVLIAGKGHEDYQILGTKKIHFSDKETALKYLRKN